MRRPVEAKAVDLLGGHTAADGGCGLQDGGPQPRPGQMSGRSEAGHAGSYDDDVHVLRVRLVRRLVHRLKHVPLPRSRGCGGFMPPTPI